MHNGAESGRPATVPCTRAQFLAGVADVLDPTAVPYTRRGMVQIGLDPPPSDATLARWRLKGRFSIRPMTFLRSGRRYTTPAAMALFFEAVTAAADGEPNPSLSRVSRQRQIRRAEEELDREGV